MNKRLNGIAKPIKLNIDWLNPIAMDSDFNEDAIEVSFEYKLLDSKEALERALPL